MSALARRVPPTRRRLAGDRAAPGTATLREGARVVLRSPGARRLVLVRLSGQGADGALQAGLTSLIFLSPERATTAEGIAVASAVLVLPFTLVGPWAAGVLDRFRRRSVLVVGGVVRAALAAATAGAVLLGSDALLAGVVLAYLSVNRLLLAALSAALPRVVPDVDLVPANALVPTLGSAAAFTGAGAGLAVTAGATAAGLSGPAGQVLVLALVAGGCLLAGVLARGFGRDQLGPDPTDARRARPSRPGADLAAVVRHLRERTEPAAALGLIALHRLGYGLMLVSALLLARNRLAGSALDATALLAAAVAASGVGFALAAALTPAGVRRWGSCGWVVRCCVLAATTPVLLLAAPHPVTLVAGAAVLGVAAQGVKVAVDALVQHGVDDVFRGRAFVVYDLCFNVALIASTALAALVLPDDGWSPPVLAALAVWWVGLAWGYRALTRRRAGRAA